MHNLEFKFGDPLFHPPPIVCRKIKLKRSGSSRAHLTAGDFLLKDEQKEFINLLMEKQSGHITRIVIQEGIPTEVDLEEAA
jgi:hypothetical protein